MSNQHHKISLIRHFKEQISHTLFKVFFFLAWTFLLLYSCGKTVEQKLVKDYYSSGVISAKILSHTTTKAVVKVRFFVYDKSNNDGLVTFNISDKITGSFDSLKRITLPYKGNFSAAFILSQGLDETVNMESFYDMLEPTVRKILHTATPANEVLLAKAGNKNNPLEIIGNGFTRNAETLDQSLAQLCKNGNYTTSDTLSLLKAIDSTINYMAAKSTYTNRHLFIFVSRRKNFWQDMDMNIIIGKAWLYNITCHIIEITYAYTWANYNFQNLLLTLNARTNGIYYETPLNYDYSYSFGELPMDLLQVSRNLPSLLTGGTDCFEMTLTLNASTPTYYRYKLYSSEFSITLHTSYEQKVVDVPFYFYIE